MRFSRGGQALGGGGGVGLTAGREVEADAADAGGGHFVEILIGGFVVDDGDPSGGCAAGLMA